MLLLLVNPDRKSDDTKIIFRTIGQIFAKYVFQDA